MNELSTPTAARAMDDQSLPLLWTVMLPVDDVTSWAFRITCVQQVIIVLYDWLNDAIDQWETGYGMTSSAGKIQNTVNYGKLMGRILLKISQLMINILFYNLVNFYEILFQESGFLQWMK